MSPPASSTPQTDTGGQTPPDSPLTTKEGWRRYVEHETHPPKPLTAAELTALTGREQARTNDRRREYHADLPLVNTPTIRKVISTARLLIQLNRHQVSARRGVIVSGASGTGKTTALTQLGRAHELAVRKRHPHDRARLPVCYVTVPPAATPKMLAMEFARFFGLAFPTRATITDIVDAVCATAAHLLLASAGRRHRGRAGPVPRRGRPPHHLPLQPARPRRRRPRALGSRRLLALTQPTPDHLHTQPRPRQPPRPRNEPARPT
jgi:hypothetical protein